jgi:hypothetical protein
MTNFHPSFLFYFALAGMTALCHASLKGRADIVELLLAQQPQPSLNFVDAHGSTPLVLAVSSGHHHVAALLVKQHPPPVIATRREQSIMMGLLHKRGEHALANQLAQLPLLSYEGASAMPVDDEANDGHAGGQQQASRQMDPTLPRGMFSRPVKVEL